MKKKRIARVVKCSIRWLLLEFMELKMIITFIITK